MRNTQPFDLFPPGNRERSNLVSRVIFGLILGGVGYAFRSGGIELPGDLARVPFDIFFLASAGIVLVSAIFSEFKHQKYRVDSFRLSIQHIKAARSSGESWTRSRLPRSPMFRLRGSIRTVDSTGRFVFSYTFT